MNKYVAVELDVALDYDVETGEPESIPDMLENVVKGRDMSVRLVKKAGPAGHPLVQLVGPVHEVVSWMQKHGYDIEDYGAELTFNY